MRRRENWILLFVLVLLALLGRCLQTPQPASSDTVTIWGIACGMTMEQVKAAVPMPWRRATTCDGRTVWEFGRRSGDDFTVVAFGSDQRVQAVRGSAVELNGHRWRLPLTEDRLRVLFGPSRRSGDDQRYFPDLRLGFQLRSVINVDPRVQHELRHATCAWIGAWRVAFYPRLSASNPPSDVAAQ